MTDDAKQKPHPFAELFVKNRHLLILFVMVAIVGGLSALKGLPRLEDPVITNRFPLVITVFPGASADRVESLVSERIERELKEIAEIKNIDSTSRAGVSVVSIELVDAVTADTNKEVFSEIRDRLADAAAAFPPEVLPPDFDDKRNAVAFTLTVALKWEAGGEEGLGILKRQAEELADRLRSVSGTELVRLYGEPEEEILVEVDQDELAALGLSMDAVSSALRLADAKVPSGQLRGEDASILVEVSGELDSVERIRSVPILMDEETARTVRVSDVAVVKRGYRDPPDEVALADGSRAVYVAARVLDDRRVDEWSAAAKRVVVQFRDEVGGGILVEEVFDQETYTTERLSALSGNLMLGAVVVMVVVFMMMGWRSSLVVGLALPMTASLTLFIVALRGGALHQMSIFGMIIALGLLIDNAIVMTDEVGKNRRRGLGPVEAMSAAVRHLFLPLLSSTLTTMLAFMPILLLPGNAGDFVSSIASSVIVAIGVSFIVAMTVIGAFAALWGSVDREANDGARRWWRDGIGGKQVSEWAERVMGVLIGRPWIGVGTALLIPAVGFYLAGTLGSQFFPRTDRNMFEVEVWLPTESSVENTRRVAEEIEATIRARDSVESVDWLVGGSFPPVYYNLIMNQDGASNYAHGIVTARDFESVSGMIEGLQADIDETFPEAQVVVTKFAQGPPADADVEIRLMGPSIEVLQDLGEQVRVLLAEHPGILQTQVTMPRGEPKFWLDADEEEARLAGLRLTDIAGQLQGKLEGRTGGSVLEGIEEMPVRIRYSRERRDDITEIEDVNLVSAAGEDWIPLTVLGDMELRPEQGGITRRNGMRVNKVFGFARPDALAIGITGDVMAALDAEGFQLPAGYRLELGGESENQAEAVGNLMLYLPVILVLTVAILILSFRSVRIAVILLTVAPLSVGFGLLATWAMQFPLSFNTIIGSMGLMGLAFNSSIVVLAAIRAEGRAKVGDTSAIVVAVLGSGRHLVSTTLTTMGSFLPLLVFIGGQFWPPLAIVLVGGVGGSTLLAMTFTPAMYRLLVCPEQQVCLFHRWWKRDRKEGDCGKTGEVDASAGDSLARALD
ncbi:MAG: efflux RND transporter permease subunit [Verrucomicrobiota bacterium]